MDIQRRLNLIVYLEKHYRVSYGGHLGLWDHDKVNNLPGQLKKRYFQNSIELLFLILLKILGMVYQDQLIFLKMYL